MRRHKDTVLKHEQATQKHEWHKIKTRNPVPVIITFTDMFQQCRILSMIEKGVSLLQVLLLCFDFVVLCFISDCSCFMRGAVSDFVF
jgi:hypothetical protein